MRSILVITHFCSGSGPEVNTRRSQGKGQTSSNRGIVRDIARGSTLEWTHSMGSVLSAGFVEKAM